MVRGDKSQIFSKALLIIQTTIVMHTSELYPTFSNQTNQQWYHVTNKILDGTERLQKNSVSILHNASQLKNKIMVKDHLLASTKKFISSAPEFSRRHKSRYPYSLGFIFPFFAYLLHLLCPVFSLQIYYFSSCFYLISFSLLFMSSFPPITYAIKYSKGKYSCVSELSDRGVSIAFSLEIQIV